MVQGAIAQGAMVQGVRMHSAMVQGAMVRGAMVQGAVMQGAMVQSTMVQSLVQRAVHHMHHAPLRGANPWFGQRQLARVPHIPSHGTMTPPNTLILRSTLRKKLIKISRASNFAAVPQSPSMNATFFCRPSLSRLLLFRPRLFGLFVTKGCTDDNLHSAALLSVCYPT